MLLQHIYLISLTSGRVFNAHCWRKEDQNNYLFSLCGTKGQISLIDNYLIIAKVIFLENKFSTFYVWVIHQDIWTLPQIFERGASFWVNTLRHIKGQGQRFAKMNCAIRHFAVFRYLIENRFNKGLFERQIQENAICLKGDMMHLTHLIANNFWMRIICINEPVRCEWFKKKFI